MFADLKPYPRMKPSGVGWLGEVPAHWDVVTLRRNLRPFDGIKIGPFGSQLKLELMSPSGYKVYGQANVIAKDFARGTKFVSHAKFKELSACQVLPGDLLVTMMGTSGRCADVPKGVAAGIMDSHLLRLRTTASIDVKFASLLIDESPYVKEQITVVGKGSIMHGLNSAMIKDLILALPPLSEQTAIVRFLDHADRRIRRYIRAKQKLIALLEEQKRAIIHQAVTGQIDVRTGQPYPAYKPSVVESLGEAPVHWEVSRVKAEFYCLNHRRLPLSGTQRGAMTLRRYDYYGASGVIDKVDDYLFDDELLLIAEDGANLVLRNLPLAIIARGRFWVNNHAHILKPKRSHLEYLAEVMEGLSYLPWISGAAQPKLTQDRLMSIAIAVPPREEQGKIVSFTATETSHLRIAIDRTQREIELHREYRTRLIADVVTGKLDVREAAATLPEVGPLTADDTLDDTLNADAESALDEHDAIPEEVEA